jgi:GT2 family glycosyltransferase
LRLDPIGYLQAVGWRIRGLKVRSRNRIAKLAGHSRWAYPFWIACKEPAIRSAFAVGPSCDRRTILPVIDCGRGAENIETTLESLPTGSNAVAIGESKSANVLTVRNPAELAGLIREPEVWLCPISCGDRLSHGALGIYAKAIEAGNGAGVVYADDDLIDANGDRTAPHFKPDWNPELFEHHDFVSGACVVRVDREALGGLPARDWVRAAVGEAVLDDPPPVHVPLVLHHRRDRPQPAVPAKPKKISLEREWPLVSVIVPTRNRSDLLRKCIEGLGGTDYPNMEILVVDNDSDEPGTTALLAGLRTRGVQVIPVAGEFNFSRLNNVAVGRARGELLCFLNNDVEMIDPDWLSLLAVQALKPDIGAVGARLVYPDGTIQHAGVFTGVGGGAAHGHRSQRQDDCGYFERARLPQRVSAVTGACLVVARDKFIAAGGFDEDTFPVAFNDVDLCLKLNERGWQAFYEPRATLVHHESKSRGSDRSKENRARFAGELAALKKKWHTDERRDPFHHPQLSPFCEQFLIAV